ncbi:MAG: FtsB family cell division protein [Desulfobacterales bacterium]
MKLASDKSVLADIFLWAAAAAMGAYLIATVFGDQGFLALKSMQQELSSMQEENSELEKKNMDLYRTINRIKNDPEYIEHTARRELHMVAPDETVFKFVADPEGYPDE